MGDFNPLADVDPTKSGALIPGVSNKKAADPAGLFSKKSKKPKKTAQQEALERRQTMSLNKAIEEEELRLKALRRGTLGNASLLGGAARTAAQAATRTTSTASTGMSRSLFSGGGRANSSMVKK